MHILERYALSCGVKIDKPQIYTKFYPNNFGKYITLQASSGMEAKNYDLYQEVVEILSPYLSELGIQVVQIGNGKDKKLYFTLGQIDEDLYKSIKREGLTIDGMSCSSGKGYEARYNLDSNSNLIYPRRRFTIRNIDDYLNIVDIY